MKHLRAAVEDYQDELRALGDSFSDEDSSEEVPQKRDLRSSAARRIAIGLEGDDDDRETAPFASSTCGYDWNRQFQAIISQLKLHGDIMEHRVRCYRTLSNLALDFIHCAKVYGRLIISEAATPDANKTILPTKIGGFAGGDKYIVNNILFKFAVDSQNMFDFEEAAHKIAGHDL